MSIWGVEQVKISASTWRGDYFSRNARNLGDIPFSTGIWPGYASLKHGSQPLLELQRGHGRSELQSGQKDDRPGRSTFKLDAPRPCHRYSIHSLMSCRGLFQGEFTQEPTPARRSGLRQAYLIALPHRLSAQNRRKLH